MTKYDLGLLVNLTDNEEETSQFYSKDKYDLLHLISRILGDCERAQATSLVLTITLVRED